MLQEVLPCLDVLVLLLGHLHLVHLLVLDYLEHLKHQLLHHLQEHLSIQSLLFSLSLLQLHDLQFLLLVQGYLVLQLGLAYLHHLVVLEVRLFHHLLGVLLVPFILELP